MTSDARHDLPAATPAADGPAHQGAAGGSDGAVPASLPPDWRSAVVSPRRDDAAARWQARVRDAQTKAERRAAASSPPTHIDEPTWGTRAGIEQAKGVLIAVFGLDQHAAGDVLTWAATRAGRPLEAVASRFLDQTQTILFGAHPTGELTRLLAILAGGDTPGGDTPGGDTPGGDTPGGDTPGGDTAGEDTPSEDTTGDRPDRRLTRRPPV